MADFFDFVTSTTTRLLRLALFLFFFFFFEVAFQGPGSNFKLPLTTECVVVYFSPKVLKRVIVAVSGY